MPESPAAPSRDFLLRRLESNRASLYAHAVTQLPPEDAHDIVQEVLTAACASKKDFDASDGDRGVASYLHRILRNKLGQWHARRRAESRRLEQLAQLRDEVEDQSVALAEMMEELRAVMRHTSLTPLQEACMDGAIDGYTGQEIAARLGIHPSGVTRHRQAAIAHLALTVQRGMMDTSEPGFRVGGEFVSFVALCRVTRYFRPVSLGSRLWRERQAKLP